MFAGERVLIRLQPGYLISSDTCSSTPARTRSLLGHAKCNYNNAKTPWTVGFVALDMRYASF
jgi:hypothetical protein